MSSAACANCPQRPHEGLEKLGVDMTSFDHVVALAGNPNTGKSTVFNDVTGLRQHTGNWPGKTVQRAEGAFRFNDSRYKVVDLPGTYSLLATSTDEEVARNFILFGSPDVTIVVVDATRLERNLNLALQVLEITDRVVVCLNLVDEARRRGISVDHRRLARDLGIPVVPTAARSGEGIDELLRAVDDVATGRVAPRPSRIHVSDVALSGALDRLSTDVEREFPGLPNARWVALRLLEGDESIGEAVQSGELAVVAPSGAEALGGGGEDRNRLLDTAETLRLEIGREFDDRLMEEIYGQAARLADRAVTKPDEKARFDLDRAIDRVVTSRIWGFPIMLALFALVFWITITGANYPSSMLATLFLDMGHPFLKGLAATVGLPWWLSGLLIDGVYLATAWVVSVMLPPMAIFFPLFTLLEDFGYLPRVAFNLDKAFHRAGAHGKQALTMMMGFGCNAAGVVASRVIDSPRERLVAIVTNNFALCNGRWPTQILVATLFIGSMVPAYLAGLVSAAAVVGVALLGVVLSFVVSWGLTRTILKGEVSTFSLELPPYRPPRVLRTIYTSLIDRTVFVLWRAVVFAVPAGAVIWLISNIHVGELSVAEHMIAFLDPFGILLGLNGIILVAYIVAIPANEIVIPTILMLIVLSGNVSGIGEGAGVMFELESLGSTYEVLRAGGWTLLTGLNVMLFSLIHNPCSTTLYTIYKETGSGKWTAVSAVLPLVLGFLVTFVVAQLWRIGASLL